MSAKIIFGEVDRIVEVAIEKIPYGLALIVCDKNRLNLSLTLSNKLKEKGIKAITIITEGQGVIGERYLGNLLHLPENVRLIIALGEESFNIANCVSALKNIGVIFYADNLFYPFYPREKALYKSENGLVKLDNKIDSFFVIDKDCILKNKKFISNAILYNFPSESIFIFEKCAKNLQPYELFDNIIGAKCYKNPLYVLAENALKIKTDHLYFDIRKVFSFAFTIATKKIDIKTDIDCVKAVAFLKGEKVDSLLENNFDLEVGDYNVYAPTIKRYNELFNSLGGKRCKVEEFYITLSGVKIY